MAYTAQFLLDQVRLRGMLPAAVTLGLTDEEILAQADNEMESTLIPDIVSVSEEFFVNTVDIPLVANQTQYRIPNNNVGGRIRNVSIINNNLQTQLSRIEPERLSQYTINGIGAPLSFYMAAGTINLVPAPGYGGGSLRVRYYARPGLLSVTASDYIKMSGVSYNGDFTTMTFSAGGGGGSLIPSTGNSYDFIANRSPFETALQGGIIAGAGPFTLTQATNLPQTLAANDYICLPDRSPVLQVPVEAQSYFIQRTLCAVLAQLGDDAKLVPALAQADKFRKSMMTALTPRTDGNPQKMRGLLSGWGIGNGWGNNSR